MLLRASEGVAAGTELRAVIRSARALDEAALRALWRVRLANIRLRAEVDPDQDFRRFRDYFEGDVRVAELRRAGGELEGFIAWFNRTTRFGGRERLLFNSSYAFVNAAYRGHAAMRRAKVRMALSVILDGWRTPRYSVVVAYPPAAVAMAPYVRSTSSPHDHAAGSWRHEALAAFLDEHEGDDWDPVTGLVRMRTIPTVSLHQPTTALGRRALAWYQERNPGWREGYGLPLLVESDVPTLARGALAALGLGKTTT